MPNKPGHGQAAWRADGLFIKGKRNYAHLPRAIDPALKKVHFKAIFILCVERAGAHVRIYARLITLAKLRLQPSGRSVAAASPPACRSVLV